MELTIKVLDVGVPQFTKTAQGGYNKINISYKELPEGKVGAKTIMSFGNSKEAFITVKGAQPGEVYRVVQQKNDKGFWEWLTVIKTEETGETETVDAVPLTATRKENAYKSTYETPQERAARQVSIQRQSSISNAILALKTDKNQLSVEEVLQYAGQLEAWVARKADAFTEILNMDDDIPL